MYDAVMRALRDAPGKFWQNYRRAWKQNWRQSLLPGMLFCFMLGLYIFMAMLFWWSTSFPGWGTLAIYVCSLLIFTMCFSLYWVQIVLFEQPFTQNLRNCLLFILRFPWKVLGISVLQLLYWTVMVLFLPWSVLLLPIIGFWFILYTVNFLIYNTFDEAFHLETLIAESFPEQTPFYEDDETWLKRKQEETA
jgi:hypothetical protein